MNEIKKEDPNELQKHEAKEIQNSVEPIFWSICLDPKGLAGITENEPYPVFFFDITEDQIIIKDDTGNYCPHEASSFKFIKSLEPIHELKKRWIMFEEETKIKYPANMFEKFIRNNKNLIEAVLMNLIEEEEIAKV